MNSYTFYGRFLLNKVYKIIFNIVIFGNLTPGRLCFNLSVANPASLLYNSKIAGANICSYIFFSRLQVRFNGGEMANNMRKYLNHQMVAS